ncbi:MAG: NAD(+) diphosphatase [Gammaproteobacteria bacterium]|nr:NAD(+) diphosphatase [Gammaproteobacteria bacterium]HBW82848.1 NAD(+) diphosphatase [Gammaproteobacteria bacterium]|tara:strand:- start:8388 stop:9188 length:801 start_codon:yes stop_codon:yes gene_type:complete
MSGYFFSKDSLAKSDRILLFVGNRILVKNGDFLWRREQVPERFIAQDTMIKVSYGGEDFLVTRAPEGVENSLDAELTSLRSLMFEGGERAMLVAGKANQLLDWHASHQFCGFCGEKTIPDRSGQALFCIACRHAFFPRINPCVIMLVVDGHRILLARNARFRAEFYSCLAGFIEVGESAEDTVRREVKEEVNLDVGAIRYYKSQSWPFPSQLMLGFYADFASGHIRPEPGEIEEADWYDIHELPKVPSARVSVAGDLIEHYVKAMK